VLGSGGGIVGGLRGGSGPAGELPRVGVGGGVPAPVGRGGNTTPVGWPLLPARRGGSGGKRRPHDAHTADSSAFSALQNGQNRISAPRSFP
jgi:hypothetical protein